MSWLPNFVFKVVCLNWEPFCWLIGKQCYIWDVCMLSHFSHVWLFVTPMDCSTPGFPIPHRLPDRTQTHVHWVSDAIQLASPTDVIFCHPLLLLPSIFPSIRVFSNESTLHIRWSKYWSFSFSISPSNEYSGLISFRIDWFDLLTQWNYEPCCVGPPKMDTSWWRILTKCGLLEKRIANHFIILALRTLWTVWKGSL